MIVNYLFQSHVGQYVIIITVILVVVVVDAILFLDIDISTISSRKEVEEFFDEMDRDFDGRLSFSEFMGEETPLEKLFKSMDKDGDGTVTKEVNNI